MGIPTDLPCEKNCSELYIQPSIVSINRHELDYCELCEAGTLLVGIFGPEYGLTLSDHAGGRRLGIFFEQGFKALHGLLAIA